MIRWALVVIWAAQGHYPAEPELMDIYDSPSVCAEHQRSTTPFGEPASVKCFEIDGDKSPEPQIRALACDSDGTRSAETACPAPVPQDCQARAESIAQNPHD